MTLPVDRVLRALVLAALEDLAAAERSGRWLAAVPALDTVLAELRRRASGGYMAPEQGRAARDLAGGRTP